MKTKKQFFTLTLVVLLPLFASADVWQDPKTMVNYIYTPGQSEAKVMEGTDMEGMWLAGSPDVSGDINILSDFTVNGDVYTVTAIGDGAFTWCDNVTKVSIPNTVKNIGRYSFSDCRGLTEIIIPNSVTEIEENAFYGCTEVSSLTIGNSVKDIGTYAFFGLYKLTSLIIPNSVVNIGDRAFESCFQLTSLFIPSSVKTIGYDAFYSCSNLTFVCIDDIAAWCNIRFSSGTGTNPLSYSHRLYVPFTEDFPPTLNDSLYMTNIGNKLYVTLGDLVIPNSVTSIENYAFCGCDYIYSVTIPNSVTSIGDDAFFSCNSLTSVTLPSSLTFIGSYAFWDTPWYDVWYKSQKPGLLYMGNYLFGYKDNKPTGELIIKEGTRTIVGNAFYDCDDISSVVMPNTVAGIGNRAFYACSNITSVNIPISVTTIGDNAFGACRNLSTISLPNSIKSIGYSVFFNCQGIKDIYSYIIEPFDIDKSVFECLNYGSYYFTDATLYVPAGTKSKYESTTGWSAFKNIVEMGAGGTYSAITPMVTASWHQKSPFNDECPDGAAAGCGAVAVAQILNYYKKPEHGYGHVTYNSEDVDFEANPIAWGSIRDVYGTGSTDAERAAVARLVHQVGAAMKMQYGSSSSPANRASMMWGLQHYLHFSPLSRYRYRRYYSTEQWLRMLDSELEAKRPVFYRGDHSSFEKALTGHIFVIDGRDSEGRYHFNFGHASSTQDKYASLNIINQGTENFIGRKSNGSDNAAYDYCQAMITSFFPVDGLTDADYDAANIMITKPMVIDGDRTPRTVSMTGTVTISFQFQYVSFTAGSIQYSIGFYQNGILKGVSTTTRTATLSDGGRGINATDRTFSLPTGLANGEYEMSVVSRTDSSAPWLRAWDSAPNSIPATVNGSTFTFSIPSFHDGETNLRLQAEPTIVSDGVVEFTVVNSSENNFEGTIKVTCGDTENSLLTAVYEGQSVTYRFPIGSNSTDGLTISYLADGSEQWLSLNSNGFLLGDINLDGEVDGTDLVLLTNMIMTNDSSNKIADMNSDGEVDGTDYVLMVNKIMGFTSVRRETAGSDTDIANTSITAEPIAVRVGESTTLTIGMDNPEQAVTLVQMDITLPKGLTLDNNDNFDNMDNHGVMMAGRTSWRNHTLMANDLGDRTRLLLASATNEVIAGAHGGIITLTLKADEDFCGGDIVLSNIICTSPDAATARPNDYVMHLGGDATGIAEVANGTSKNADCAYDLSGRRIGTSVKKKGVYIVGGRKVVK